MNKKKKFSMTAFVICLIAALTGLWMVLYMRHEGEHNTLNALMQNEADNMQANVMKSLNQAYDLQALVLGAGGDESAIDLSVVGPYLIRETNVKNILIAPQGVVSQVYPLEGNEAVLGLDLYSSRNASSAEAIKAKESRELVVTGPYDLVQGGQAISGRKEVSIPQEDGSLKDWGLVSVTLAFPEVMKDSTVNYLEESGYISRVLKQNEAEQWDIVLDNHYVECSDYEMIYFSIQNMHFMLQCYPKNGWYQLPLIAAWIVCIFIASFLVSILVQMITSKRNQLEEKATMDALTGIRNRDSGARTINQIIKNTEFEKGAFLLIDIDHFKKVNDVLGHQQGDQVLIQTARLLNGVCRSNDIICRLGGDEFVLFLPCQQPERFIQIKTEKINELMRQTITVGEKTVSISGSIGVALAEKDGENFETLYQHADEALYKSKEKGRDCTSFYGGSI